MSFVQDLGLAHLTIHQVGPVDSGQYTCVVTAQVQHVSKTITSTSEVTISGKLDQHGRILRTACIDSLRPAPHRIASPRLVAPHHALLSIHYRTIHLIRLAQLAQPKHKSLPQTGHRSVRSPGSLMYPQVTLTIILAFAFAFSSATNTSHRSTLPFCSMSRKAPIIALNSLCGANWHWTGKCHVRPINGTNPYSQTLEHQIAHMHRWSMVQTPKQLLPPPTHTRTRIVRWSSLPRHV